MPQFFLSSIELNPEPKNVCT